MDHTLSSFKVPSRNLPEMMDFNRILSVSVISHYNCEAAMYLTIKNFQGFESFVLLMSKKN